MALLNELNLEGLTIAEAYWRVGSFEWSAGSPELIRLRLDGYASQESYQSGYGALQSFNKDLQLDLLDAENPLTILFGRIRSACYQDVKASVGFEEATDA